MVGVWRWLLAVSLVVACDLSPRGIEAPTQGLADAETAAEAPQPPRALVDRAKQLLAHDDVRTRGERSLSVVHKLDSEKIGRSSRAVADAMMDTVFDTASALYGELGGELDGLAQSFAYHGNVIATIRFTRETFDAVNYDQRMVHLGQLESAAWSAVAARELTEDEAKTQTDQAERAAYAEMLSVLPHGDVRIDMRYRP